MINTAYIFPLTDDISVLVQNINKTVKLNEKNVQGVVIIDYFKSI